MENDKYIHVSEVISREQRAVNDGLEMLNKSYFPDDYRETVINLICAASHGIGYKAGVDSVNKLKEEKKSEFKSMVGKRPRRNVTKPEVQV